MDQRGFIPIVVIVGIVALAILGGGAIFFTHKSSVSQSADTVPVQTEISPSPSASSVPVPTVKPSIKPSIKPSATPTAKPSSTPTSTSQTTTTTITTTNTSSTQPKVSCDVVFDPTSGTAPVDVKLIYGASYSGSNNYVTNVQWDWDGDGNWDTDFSEANQHLTHTYTKAGTYNARLRVQTKQGDISDTCSKSITIQ